MRFSIQMLTIKEIEDIIHNRNPDMKFDITGMTTVEINVIDYCMLKYPGFYKRVHGHGSAVLNFLTIVYDNIVLDGVDRSVRYIVPVSNYPVPNEDTIKEASIKWQNDSDYVDTIIPYWRGQKFEERGFYVDNNSLMEEEPSLTAVYKTTMKYLDEAFNREWNFYYHYDMDAYYEKYCNVDKDTKLNNNEHIDGWSY